MRLPARGTNTVTRRLTLVLSHESGGDATACARTRRTSTWRALFPPRIQSTWENLNAGAANRDVFPTFLRHFLRFPRGLPAEAGFLIPVSDFA